MSNVTGVPAGVDTLGIAVPITDFDKTGCSVQIDRYQQAGESFRYSRKLKGGGFVGTGVGATAWLEASLPKRLSPEGDNSTAVDLDTAIDAMWGMLVEAQEFIEVDPAHVFDESRIVRLDLVRDFQGVDRQTEVLDGLAAITQPGRAKVRRFADPSANRAETLRVGPRAWGCTLYDKHQETGGRAAPGHLRFEARLHRDQLTSVFARHNGGIVNTIEDLYRMGRDFDGDNGTALAQTQFAWFRRVGFHQEIPATHQLVNEIRRLELTAARAASLWAFLTLPGWAAACSRNTRAKYRQMAEQLDMCPRFDAFDRPVLLDASKGKSLRLDYISGTQIAA